MRKINLIIFSIVVFITLPLTNALADWRKDIGIFRIGVVSNQAAAVSIQKFEPFRKAISNALEMDAEIFPARNETNLIQALAADRIEYAVLSTSGYALAWVICECVEPLVTARAIDSSDSYHTVMITSASGPASLEELENAKIGVLTKQSISGHPFAKYLLAQDNIKIDTPQKPFIRYDSGAETLASLRDKELDVIVGWSSMNGNPTSGYSRGTLKELAQLNNGDGKPYQIIWQSPAIPYRPHVVAKKLPGQAKMILRSTMEALFDRNPVAYDVVEPQYGGGFVVSRHGRFETLIEFVQSLYKPPLDPIITSDQNINKELRQKN